MASWWSLVLNAGRAPRGAARRALLAGELGSRIERDPALRLALGLPGEPWRAHLGVPGWLEPGRRRVRADLLLLGPEGPVPVAVALRGGARAVARWERLARAFPGSHPRLLVGPAAGVDAAEAAEANLVWTGAGIHAALGPDPEARELARLLVEAGVVDPRAALPPAEEARARLADARLRGHLEAKMGAALLALLPPELREEAEARLLTEEVGGPPEEGFTVGFRGPRPLGSAPLRGIALGLRTLGPEALAWTLSLWPTSDLRARLRRAPGPFTRPRTRGAPFTVELHRSLGARQLRAADLRRVVAIGRAVLRALPPGRDGRALNLEGEGVPPSAPRVGLGELHRLLLARRGLRQALDAALAEAMAWVLPPSKAGRPAWRRRGGGLRSRRGALPAGARLWARWSSDHDSLRAGLDGGPTRRLPVAPGRAAAPGLVEELAAFLVEVAESASAPRASAEGRADPADET